jgi:chemotaxis response regulator CheB
VRRWLEAVALRRALRAPDAPVTDPLRVMVVDPEVHSATALGRAIDLDRDMAVVGNCRDLRRAAGDAARCGPDLVAVRLSVEDSRCRDVLADLAAAPGKPCVVVLGPAGDPAMAAADAARLLVRIKAVATAALDRGAVLSPVVVTGERGLPVPVSRLN